MYTTILGRIGMIPGTVLFCEKAAPAALQSLGTYTGWRRLRALPLLLFGKFSSTSEGSDTPLAPLCGAG